MDAFLWAAFALILLIVIIVVAGIIVRAAITSGRRGLSHSLVSKLTADNAHMKAELAEIKENLIAINKMLKEIE